MMRCGTNDFSINQMEFAKHFRKYSHIFLLSIVLSIALFPIISFASQVIVIIQGTRDATIGTDYVDFGTWSTSSSDQTMTDVHLGADGIIVDDLDSSAVSWSVSISAENFTSASGLIPYTNLKVKADDDGVIDVIGGTSNADGITTFNTFQAFSGGGSVSNPIALIVADNRTRSAVYQTFPEFQLGVPAFTDEGVYNSMFTFTFLVD